MIEFIAEVSSNHHSSLDRALKLVDAAASAGCSAVKFQLFRVNKLFSQEILAKSEVHRRRQGWELPLDFLPIIFTRCKEKGIQFSCTPFYLEAVSELEAYVDFYKIASYELLWDDLLAKCAQTGKRIILSTGMATMDEIKHAVGVLIHNGCPNPTLLHCTSAYPTPHVEANLSAIKSIGEATGCEVGWSDHTVEPAVLYRAINRWGAKVIEFHIDLDGQGEEFDSGHCWLPSDISEVIDVVKMGFEADGDGEKGPAPSELEERLWRADPSDGLRPLKITRKKWI
jgi:N-acetylneuraminate synthase